MNEKRDWEKITIVRQCPICKIEKLVTRTVKWHRTQVWVCNECEEQTKKVTKIQGIGNGRIE